MILSSVDAGAERVESNAKHINVVQEGLDKVKRILGVLPRNVFAEVRALVPYEPQGGRPFRERVVDNPVLAHLIKRYGKISRSDTVELARPFESAPNHNDAGCIRAGIETLRRLGPAKPKFLGYSTSEKPRSWIHGERLVDKTAEGLANLERHIATLIALDERVLARRTNRFTASIASAPLRDPSDGPGSRHLARLTFHEANATLARVTSRHGCLHHPQESDASTANLYADSRNVSES